MNNKYCSIQLVYIYNIMPWLTESQCHITAVHINISSRKCTYISELFLQSDMFLTYCRWWTRIRVATPVPCTGALLFSPSFSFWHALRHSGGRSWGWKVTLPFDIENSGRFPHPLTGLYLLTQLPAIYNTIVSLHVEEHCKQLTKFCQVH